MKPTLTSGIGNFSFTLPAEIGTNYFYNDIGNFYKAKIYLGYDTIGAGDLQMVGRIKKFTSYWNKNGATRLFEGKDQGEILERRFKTNVHYQDEDASPLVGDLAIELGLGLTEIDVDNSHVTLTVQTESYFSLLQKISDYWVSAGVQIQKDFYVDNDYNLVWKARPIRTVGVEDLSIDKLTEYSLIYDILPTKNYLTVYGAASGYLPNDKDIWTEGTGGAVPAEWTRQAGNTLLMEFNPARVKMGTYSVECTNNTAAPWPCKFKYTFADHLTIRDLNVLNFWYLAIAASGISEFKVRIYAPLAGDSFYKTLSTAVGFHWADLPLGGVPYDATENPDGWVSTGAPNWWHMTALEFEVTPTANELLDVCIDKLYFSPYRWTTGINAVYSVPSENSYGRCEAEYTDENLTSAAECTIRAQTLLYQLKDRALRLDLTIPGNLNVKIGDRIPMTLPPDNVTAVDFDVVSVEHILSNAGFTTNASMIYGAVKRKLPPRNMAGVISTAIGSLQQVAAGIFSKVVR